MTHTSSHYQFAVDFTMVPELPADPKDRLSYFNALKKLLGAERGKIKAWHRGGAGGREVIQAHTALTDEIIRHIIRALSALKTYSKIPVLEDFTLIAVGGYGRGELNPFSDIDLLFLLPKSIRKITNQFIQDYTSILWGIGLDIGQSCRTLKDCLKLAESDLTIKTSMIETRFIIGNLERYETFEKSIQKNILNRHVPAFLKAKAEEKAKRYQFSGGVAGNPEPNIKEDPGGLRDYHTALWAVAVRFGCLSFREIGNEDIVSQQELDTLDLAVNFSLRVRNELHYLKEKKFDQLTLDRQKHLAANLGYRADSEIHSVENFMSEYFTHATHIHNITATIFERCLEHKRPIRKILSTFKKKALRDGFIQMDSSLVLGDKNSNPFPDNPRLLLTLFTICSEHQLEPDYKLRRLIKQNRHLLDEELFRQVPARQFLFSLLDRTDSERILRLMDKLEVLGQILPEFGHAHCRVKYDFYHRYTADEHSLRIIHFLEELGDDPDKRFGELTEVYAEIPAKFLLKFSALLQSAGQDPAEMTPQKRRDLLSGISSKWHLNQDERDTIIFLLENYYEMAETALHQDMHQPSVIKTFAKKLGSIERLNMLYLFIYAELRAVAPGTWNAWKKMLLSELYHRTREYLKDPQSMTLKIRTTEEQVHKTLQGETRTEDIQDHIRMMPDDYLVTSNSALIAQHIRLTRSLRGGLFRLNHHYHEDGGFHNLTLCCASKQDAFKKVVGTLTAKSLNILGTQVYLRKDGIVFIGVQVEANDKLESGDMHTWEQIEQNLGDIFEGRKKLRELLAARTRYISEKKTEGAIVPKVKIDNSSESQHSIVRIEARDHLGMLYKIAAVFADLGIQIHRAKISIQGGRGIDVFYVSHMGNKILFKHLLRRVKERLIQAMLIEKPEDI